MKLIKFIFLTLFSFTPFVEASTCCGGSVSAPALIAGDDKAQVSLSMSRTEVTDDVYANGLWRSRDFSETTETFTLEGAHVFRDRWQAGLSLPVIRREKLGHHESGIGDVTANLGYEYLPDWDYNPYRPRGLGFLKVTAPAGRSVFESKDLYQLDTRGRGFWALGLGTLLTKFWGPWDVLSVLSVHRSLPRGEIAPGWGGSVGIGAGFSYQEFRAGSNLSWTYEDPIHRSGSIESRGAVQRFGAAAISLSYMPNDDWSGTVTFQDQTLVGSPINTNLGRGVQLQVQRRWSR